MKVLFWMNSGFDNHTTSEHLLKAVIEQLATLGNQVHVIQMNQGGPLPELSKELIDHGVSSDSVFYKAPSKGNFVARYFGAIKYYMNCRQALRNNADSDAVFLQSTNVAVVSAYLARKYNKHANIVLNVQDIFPYNASFSGSIKSNGIIFRIMSAIQRKGYGICDRIITISEDMKKTLVEDGIAADKIEVVYNWSYQDELYDQSTLDMSVPDKLFDKDMFNVVYAGNIGVMQNVDILIEVALQMKSNKDIWFHIIGDGAYKDKLIKKAKELCIKNISFWPMQPPAAAPSIYAAADVNVIPLVKDVYKTALPSKTATCLACQKPIILAIGKESFFAKIAEKNNMLFVTDSNDAQAIANCINTIKDTGSGTYTYAFYKNNCLKTTNSKHYADIIMKI